MTNYYNGLRLLSMKDINGKTPEIFICTSNRSAGKTVFFNSYTFNRYLEAGEKFCLVYRFNYELDECSTKFFSEIGPLFFGEYELSSKKQSKGAYHEIFINKKGSEEKESCGYAIALNMADQIKKVSNRLSDTKRMLFDEFQSETNHYCFDEVKKFISVHTSIARGGGAQSRYLPVIMIANPISMVNPYYSALGISTRLKPDTKFLRGDGFVLEQGYNKDASEAQKNSAFLGAFGEDKYISYTQEGSYLYDSSTFIQKPTTSKNEYLFTIKYNDKFYGVREYGDEGFIYVSDKADMSFKKIVAVDLADHGVNYVLLSRLDPEIARLKFLFDRGCCRFNSVKSKEAFLKLICYDII